MAANEIRYARTTGGVNIAFAVCGEGFPLLISPAWVSNAEEHLATWPEVEGYQLICFDKRGTGLSDRGTTALSIEDRMLDLDAVARTLGLDQFALFGGSEGGPAAIAYAAEHPQRVSALVLLGGYARGRDTMAVDTHEAILALVAAEWGLASQTLAALFMPGASSEEVAAFAARQERDASRTDAAAMWAAIPTIDVSDRLSDVCCPTLVMHVRGDRIVPFELGRELARAIPEARFVAIEGDRHNAGLAEAEQIRPAMLAFLAEQREARATADSDRPHGEGSPDGLTKREIEVLRHLTAGKTNQEIADVLVISLNTARRHVTHIFRKTRSANRAEAAAYAVRSGLSEA